MTFNVLLKQWNAVWFMPQSPLCMALFRIFFGITMLEYAVLIAPDLFIWFSDKGVLSRATMQQVSNLPCINILSLLPDEKLSSFFLIFVVAAAFLTIGLFTRLSAAVLFLCLVSFHYRNEFIINSGDILENLFAFYLLVSPSGDALSVDRLIHLWLNDKFGPPPNSWPWAQRLVQLQIMIIYFQAFWSKMEGSTWIDGTALYWIFREQQFQRFPVPFVPDHLWSCQTLTWCALLIECAMWSLVWIKELRYWILIAAIMLHLGIDYSMNLPIFETLMIFSFIVFVSPEHLQLCIDKAKERLKSVFGGKYLIVYISSSDFAKKFVETVRRLDFLCCFSFLQVQNSVIEVKFVKGFAIVKSSFRLIP